MGLDEINKRKVEGLRSGNKRTEDTRVYTDVKEVTTALRASRKCSAEVHRLEILGMQLQYKGAEQSTGLQRGHTFALLGCKSKRYMTKEGEALTGGCCW